ncbi:MAG: nucleoside triphosphate pyrophosphohydrolase [Gammaproteobacteria bacterium]|jgi:ATP diphosphatase|nr:nucleoside triphosphate pyrophosphohydrolase [Gammaproteobacteria bacterium]MDP6095525.1 nucleoside triphosphate pyrophosphohydrolase [Gammaproteobacteria bacterium]
MDEEITDNVTAIEKLLTIMRLLRDKKHGCPWDLEQTLKSLTVYTLEEVYEVVDAIENDDMVQVEDELGDLLFQVVFYTQIASEEGLFDFGSVADAITQKLIRRHPHVFPAGKVENFGIKSEISADQVVVKWEAIKQAERDEKIAKGGLKHLDQSSSVLNDIPLALPALERAKKLQKRAAATGFDWPELAPVLNKLKEETAELENALTSDSQSAIHHELGDVLFSAVNLARHCKIEPESALRDASKRFERRFNYIEQTVRESGNKLNELTLAQMDSLWDKAKQSGL